MCLFILMLLIRCILFNACEALLLHLKKQVMTPSQMDSVLF